MKIKRGDVVLLFNILNNIDNEISKKNFKFAYTVAKNKVILANERDIIISSMNYSDEYNNLMMKKLSIVRKYCQKNSDGTILLNDLGFPIIDENLRVEFEKELTDFLGSDDGKRLQELDMEFSKKYDIFISEEVELDLVKFDKNSIPDGAFSSDVIEVLIRYELIEN